MQWYKTGLTKHLPSMLNGLTDASIAIHISAANDVLCTLHAASARVKAQATARFDAQMKGLDDAFGVLNANASLLRAWHRNARYAQWNGAHEPVLTHVDTVMGAPSIHLVAPCFDQMEFGYARTYKFSPEHCIVSDLHDWVTHTPSVVDVLTPLGDGIVCDDVGMQFVCAVTDTPLAVAVNVTGECGKFCLHFKIPDECVRVRATLTVGGIVLQQWTVRRNGVIGILRHAHVLRDFRLYYPLHATSVCLSADETKLFIKAPVDGQGPDSSFFVVSLPSQELSDAAIVSEDFISSANTSTDAFEYREAVNNYFHVHAALWPTAMPFMSAFIKLPCGNVYTAQSASEMFDPWKGYVKSYKFAVPDIDIDMNEPVQSGGYERTRRFASIHTGGQFVKLMALGNEQLGVLDNESLVVHVYSLRTGTVLHKFQLCQAPAWTAWRQDRLLVITEEFELHVYE